MWYISTQKAKDRSIPTVDREVWYSRMFGWFEKFDWATSFDSEGAVMREVNRLRAMDQDDEHLICRIWLSD